MPEPTALITDDTKDSRTCAIGAVECGPGHELPMRDDPGHQFLLPSLHAAIAFVRTRCNNGGVHAGAR
ncbi:hypothetical protein OUZ54_04540 [Mycobacterium avium subsp. paratuberculosis]|uniref:hypothetical protein n=1 Tax=Mycobacterium avium TaxID=1764 RepID=UPI00227BDA3F|nr:hypothetical protein [Mycobacterium avium]WAI55359.1 hypothetical protein OUZ54_04540 [Mycobacterium avium subsp. paratuberculosis]